MTFYKNYTTLVNECNTPLQAIPPKSYGNPVMSKMLCDVEIDPLIRDETIPANSQLQMYNRDCTNNFTGVGIYACKRTPYPARYAAAYLCANLIASKRVNPRLIYWHKLSYGLHDRFLEDMQFQPEILILDALYAQSSMQRIEKIRFALDEFPKTAIIIAAGDSPMNIAYNVVNTEPARVLFFA